MMPEGEVNFILSKEAMNRLKSSYAEGQDEKGGTRDGTRVAKSLVSSNFKWSGAAGSGHLTQDVSSSAFKSQAQSTWRKNRVGNCSKWKSFKAYPK